MATGTEEARRKAIAEAKEARDLAWKTYKEIEKASQKATDGAWRDYRLAETAYVQAQGHPHKQRG